MMKFVTCGALLLATFLLVESEKVMERPGHETQLKERLGHFSEYPFTDLYKHYAAAFVKPLHKERQNDDYRNYRPSGDECTTFLIGFVANDYQLREMKDFIPLDACLGFLYDNEDEGVVNESNHPKLEELLGDEKLREMWENTKINELGDFKDCVANLLGSSVKASLQYKNNRCPHDVLQVYLDFAECHKENEVSEETRKADSYLFKLFELLKTRVDICVEQGISDIEKNVRAYWKRNHLQRVSNKFTKHFNQLSHQNDQRMWPKKLITLLAAVQNTTTQVNVREVHQLLRGIYKKDEILKNRFLANIAQFATKNIKTKRNDGDASGMGRYTNLIDGLCQFLRSSDAKNSLDFATPMIRLVQLLAFKDLFEITQEEFVARILKQAKETAPVYLGIQACNVLTFTDGLINDYGNKKATYIVQFKKDTSKMVIWPDAGHY